MKSAQRERLEVAYIERLGRAMRLNPRAFSLLELEIGAVGMARKRLAEVAESHLPADYLKYDTYLRAAARSLNIHRSADLRALLREGEKSEQIVT